MNYRIICNAGTKGASASLAHQILSPTQGPFRLLHPAAPEIELAWQAVFKRPFAELMMVERNFCYSSYSGSASRLGCKSFKSCRFCLTSAKDSGTAYLTG